jgi:phage-related tail protein
MFLGNVSYSAAQLQSILAKSAKGNALITLAHQLITAKLNAANGAVPGSLLSAIAAADAIVGNLVVPPVGTDALSASSGCNDTTQELDDFNNDEDGHEHCSSTAARRDTWGAIKSTYR